MPKRKKLPEVPDYTDFGRNDSTALVVQKTKPLLSLSETSLTLPELKILDAYLARINSHDPEKRYVTFDRGEIEKYLGVTQIKMPDLEKRIKNLFQTITIKDKNKPKGFKLIALFEKAECLQDENGLWQVHLAASYSAMEYIFTPENIGYLRYYLSDVTSLTSRYSYILYLYLENNRFRKSWQVSISELKEMLRCTAETYSQFYRFNDLILKKCHKELNEKTKCHFSYSPVKRGRSVVAVCFTLEPLQCFEPEQEPPDPNQVTFDELVEAGPDYGSDPAKLFAEACNNEFTPSEIEEIMVILASIPEQKLPSSNGNGDSLHLRTFRYLEEKYLTMNRYDPDRRFNYLVKMLKKDATNYQGTV